MSKRHLRVSVNDTWAGDNSHDGHSVFKVSANFNKFIQNSTKFERVNLGRTLLGSMYQAQVQPKSELMVFS